MIIRHIDIRHFGSIEHLSLALDPAINEIIGPNESGKTTIVQAVIAILFGFKQAKAYIHTDTLLQMEVEWHTQHLLLERRQQKQKGKLAVYQDDGTYLGDDMWLQQHWQMKAGQFQDVYCLDAFQITKTATVDSEDWQRLFFSYMTMGSDQLMVKQRQYDRALQQLYHPKKRCGELLDTWQKYQEVTTTLQQLETYRATHTYSDTSSQVATIQAQLQHIDKQLSYLDDYRQYMQQLPIDYQQLQRLEVYLTQWEQCVQQTNIDDTWKAWYDSKIAPHQLKEQWEDIHAHIQQYDMTKKGLAIALVVAIAIGLYSIISGNIGLFSVSIVAIVCATYMYKQKMHSRMQVIKQWELSYGEYPSDTDAFDRQKQLYYTAPPSIHKALESIALTGNDYQKMQQLLGQSCIHDERYIQQQFHDEGVMVETLAEAREYVLSLRQQAKEYQHYIKQQALFDDLYADGIPDESSLYKEKEQLSQTLAHYKEEQIQYAWQQQQAQSQQQSMVWLRQQQAHLDTQVKEMMIQYTQLQLKRHWIDDIKDDDKAKRWPQFMSHVSEYFCQLTLQRYSTLRWQGSKLECYDTHTMQWYSIRQLSLGTRSQLLLALRLGFIAIQPEWQRMPLFLDEASVFYDEYRLRALMQVLSQLDIQVISLSHHQLSSHTVVHLLGEE